MDVKNKQTIKLSFMNPTFIGLLTFMILLISINCQQNKVLFNSSYFLLSQSDKIFIPINQSAFILSNNGTTKFLKVQVKVQALNPNGTYVDSPFQTANILVKYWKNHQNTQATNVLTFSYEKLSVTKQFPTAFDPNDGGLVDIESLYNYQNEHNFLHMVGNETSDTLFVIGIYRFANYGLTDILGMSKKSDEIKVTVTVIRGSQSDNRCQFCSSKQFCPVNQCFCSQQLYSGCNINRKKITTNVDKPAKMNDKGLINKGQIHHIQIEPQTNQKQWFPVQISLSLQSSNSLINQTPKKDRIFLLLYVQNKNDTFETIPNIYNFDFIDSPSINSRIISQLTVSSAVTDSNQPMNVRADQNSISMTERILVSKNQLIAVSVYYLNDTKGSSSPTPNSLSVSMNVDFSNNTNQGGQGQSVANLALIIGMVALAIFILILLICILHFFVSKRFSFLQIFNHLQNSNRNSLNSAIQSRNQNNQDHKLSLPTVSFDFLNDLVFKPLKYIYQPNIQQNCSKLTSQKKKFSQQNEMCSICLEQFTNQSKVKYTYCGHILDSKCLDSWLEKEMSCPMCRQKLQPKDVAQYEDRILQQIVQNEHYQSIIDEEAQTLKNMYKNWKNSKNKDIFKVQNTQQSLVNNQQVVSYKFIQNTAMPNISTMVELQRTDFNLKEAMNKKVEQSPSLVLIKPQSPINVNRIFSNNQQFSVKRFSKNYLFYRCIFLHHKINKNFDNNSDLNLYASDLQVEKNQSIFCQSKRQNKQENQHTLNDQNKILNLVQTQPYIIKPFHERQQQSLELYLNSALKIKQQLSNSQVKKNKNEPEISLYFETDHLSSQVGKQEKSKIYRDLSDSQQSIEKSSQQKSIDPDNSKSDKLKKRKNRHLTIREEMNQLQRQLQQSQKKQEPIQQNMKFSEKATSIIFFDESQDQNIRYAAAPVSIVSGQNKSQSSKICTINKTQVLILPHNKKLPSLGQQTLKTLPYSICLNQQPPISYRKISQHQQKQKLNQRFAQKNIDLEQI